MNMDKKKEKEIRLHNLTLKKSQLPLWDEIKIYKITHKLKHNNEAVVELLKKGLKANENKL